MAGRLRRGFTFANVCSFLALTIALGTGGAYAANTVFSTDIVDGEVRNADIAASAVTSQKIYNKSVTAADLADSAVSAIKLAPNAVTSSHVLNGGLSGGDIAIGTVTGVNINEATLGKVPDANTVDGLDSTALVGPRAYGRVSPYCATTSPFACPVSDARGVSAVTRPTTGVYCIAAAGIPDTTPLIATVDFVFTVPAQGDASAMADPSLGCGSGRFRVRTQRHGEAFVASPGGGSTIVADSAVHANDVGFTFMVP